MLDKLLFVKIRHDLPIWHAVAIPCSDFPDPHGNTTRPLLSFIIIIF